MTAKFTLKDFEQADSELRAAASRRHFYIHAFMYVVTNFVLVVLNLTALGQSFPWSLIPIVLWGIALLTHYFVAFRWTQSENEQWMAKTEYLAEEIHRVNEMPLRKVA
jgi:predicted membrane channel-forming protein YqfA (hemolysin III family)